jgi:hypothetical protein
MNEITRTYSHNVLADLLSDTIQRNIRIIISQQKCGCVLFRELLALPTEKMNGILSMDSHNVFADLNCYCLRFVILQYPSYLPIPIIPKAYVIPNIPT